MEMQVTYHAELPPIIFVHIHQLCNMLTTDLNADQGYEQTSLFIVGQPWRERLFSESFIEGSRLSQLRATTKLKQNVYANFSPEQQQQLRDKLTQIANRAGGWNY